MTKKLQAYKKFLATLFTGVYMFAVVFSGFFHTHTNNFKENLVSVKNAPISTKIINFGGVDDCFSSHFFNAGVAILDSEQNFSFIFHEIFVKQTFNFSFTDSTVKILFFSLRAPPSFI